MTQINFNFGVLTASGVDDVAGIPVTITPTNRFTTSDGRSVLVKPLSIALDEHGAGNVTVPETVDGKYAYRVSVGDPADSFAFVRVVKVPAADSKDTPVSFDTLQDVDVATLAPVVQSELNEQAKSIVADMQAKRQSLADATAQAQSVVDDLAAQKQSVDDTVKAINDTKAQVDAAKAAVEAVKAAVDASAKEADASTSDVRQDDAATGSDTTQAAAAPTVPDTPEVPTVRHAASEKN